MEIVRLKASDYDEWLYVLNTVFGRHNQKEMDFEKELPAMCVRDDEYMGKHFAVKEDGRICALLGVYPLPTRIGDQELMFSTVGNVATLPEYEGRGYMRALMQEAMKELERIGADASRLGGARQRYNRYGYESCGREYHFTINDHTAKYCFTQGTKVYFKEISAGDKKELVWIENLRSGEHMQVHRPRPYETLRAWQNRPFIALNEKGEMIGYLVSSQNRAGLSEVAAKDVAALKNMLFCWQKEVGGAISFVLSPSQWEAVRYFSQVAAGMGMNPPCHFKMIHYDRVADALLKLKVSYTPGLVQGEQVIEIKGWGNLLLYNKNGQAFCKKTDKAASISLEPLAASRFLFGPFEPSAVTDCGEFLSALLPLPLGWSTLDRV
ncbi:MAG: GNAT family N-acetyltransferase [Firmicutes bacterium]|nr:GNAT family N-acetyltransferase [Bacillota bacterium]